MQRYEEYKRTGVEWMPKIPVGWEAKKLKHCFNFSVGGTPSTSKESYFEGENTWVTIADMHQRVITESKTSLSEEGIAAAGMVMVPEGSLLYSFKLSVGKVAFAGKGLYTNEAIFSVLPGAGYDLTFFYYALPELLIHSAGQNIYGAKIFNQELLKNAFILLPPLEEQRAITSFLNEKTAQIDQLITQKQRMLELLQEERAALINHAVTKGLDAAAPVRDSGIEWLGEVPAHWEVKRMKHLLTGLEQGWSPSCENREAEPDEWGVLKVGCVNGLHFDASENKALPAELVPMPEYEISTGDFLISRANTKELVGSASIVAEVRPRLMLCDKLFRLYFKESANQEYVLLIIGSSYGRFQIQTECSGASSSMQNISQEFLKNMVILLPPQEEQHAIVEYVAEHSIRIKETVNTINQEITLLQEYRAALIAEAVTGQIDVRNYEPASILTAELVG